MRRFWIGLLAAMLLGCRAPGPREEPASTWLGPRPDPRASVELLVLRDLPVTGAPWSQVIEGGSWAGATLPTMVYLIRHPKGVVLVDSGYGSRHAETRGALIASIIRVDSRPPHRLVRDQLPDLGLRPEEVTHLILTHLHADHAGGAVDFPNAKVIVSRRSAEELPGSPLPSFLKQSIASRLQPIDLEAAPPYATFGHGVDLFGDGTLVLVSTPGHGAGHLSVFVHLASGRSFFLSGDVAWVRENLTRPVRKGWPMRAMVEGPGNEESLQRAHALHRLAPEITIIPGHDPDSDRDLLRPPAGYR